MRKLAWTCILAGLCASASFGAIINFKNVAGGVFSSGFSTTAGTLTSSGGGSLSVQTDNAYTLIHNPTGCAGVSCQETNTAGDLFGPATYVVLGGNGIYPIQGGVWSLPNDANSSWIGPRADQRNPLVGGTTYDNTAIFASNADFFVYRMVFNLNLLGIDPATAAINLSWLSDNATSGGGAPPSNIRMCSIASAGDTTLCATTPVGAGNNGQGSLTMTTVNIASGFTSGYMALDFSVYNAFTSPGLNPSGLRVLINSAQGQDTPEPATLTLFAAGLMGLGLYSRRARR